MDGFEADFEVSQDGRMLAINTQLGGDALLLTSLEGVETVSRGFVYTAEILTQVPDDDVRSLLGKPATIWLHNHTEEHRRPLHGHVRRLTRLGSTQRGYRQWRAEIVPYFWFLSRNRDCRVYQDLTIPEILRSIFDEYGLAHTHFRLIADYPKLVFCVQYRESSFAFASRLMEHAGIFYWHEHHADRHVLNLADSNHMAPFTQPKQWRLAERADLGALQSLSVDYAIGAGAHALKDYNFEHPSMTLHAQQPSRVAEPMMSRFEMFDYPGGYTASDAGVSLNRVRVEAEEARSCTLTGTGSCAAFDAGKRFEFLGDWAGGGKPAAYLLTEVRHSATEPGYFAAPVEPARYSNSFACVPAELPFRPERLTPKPVVQGPQTATVVGPAGENIHTDPYGRVRLLFHWDRRGKRNEEASCWVRVSQHSAGSHYGSLAIPHVGQEVVVAFLEGDPDRPLVIGRVHNGANLPPLTLPRDKDKTVIRDHGDNKLIMHGQSGQQRMSLVSPRAINLVAMRAPAKPLSASVGGNDGHDFDDGLDTNAFKELQRVYNELANPTPQPPQIIPINGAASSGNFSGTGTLTPAPNQNALSASDDPAALGEVGDFTASNIDINTLCEGNISSLCLENMNTWVGHCLNQEVIGKVYTKSHSTVENVYKSTVQNIIETVQDDSYDVHVEETAAHVEATAVHVEGTGVHVESHDLFHLEHEMGFHMHLGDTTNLTSHFKQIRFTDDQMDVISAMIGIVDQKLAMYGTKKEISQAKDELTAELHSVEAGQWMLNAEVINMMGATFQLTVPKITMNALSVQVN